MSATIEVEKCNLLDRVASTIAVSHVSAYKVKLRGTARKAGVPQAGTSCREPDDCLLLRRVAAYSSKLLTRSLILPPYSRPSLILSIKLPSFTARHWTAAQGSPPITAAMPPRPTVPAKRPVAEAQEAAWVADEDRFVLQQAKKKAAIRAKSGRALPIDWLAVTLALVDPDGNPLDDELEDGDVDSLDPEGVFEGLNEEQLSELEKGVDTYITLESNRSNLDYWNVRRQPHATLFSSTNADRLLDDENDLPGSSEILQDGPVICSRRVFRVGEHRQTACAQDPRGIAEAGGTD